MHLKVFVKLKKPYKPSRLGKKTQKNPKKPKKPQKKQKNPKKPTGPGFFFKKTRVFSNPAKMRIRIQWIRIRNTACHIPDRPPLRGRPARLGLWPTLPSLIKVIT